MFDATSAVIPEGTAADVVALGVLADQFERDTQILPGRIEPERAALLRRVAVRLANLSAEIARLSITGTKPDPRDQHSRRVRIADELLPILSTDWSPAVQVKVTREDGDELVLLFRILSDDIPVANHVATKTQS